MNGIPQSAWQPTLLAVLAMLSLPAPADTSNGPNPYAQGYGFDDPQDAPWGGWQRGQDGTLYAEWDVFSDASHGGASDRSAAPDLGSYGTASAWLGWNTGSFVAGTGNLYSFTVPEAFSVNLAGAVAASSLRVVLQVETQGLLLDNGSFRLNGTEPTWVREMFRESDFPSPLGPTDLVHRLYIWDLETAPADAAFVFSSVQPHVSLTQVAVDIGPIGSGSGLSIATPLPAESLEATLATALAESGSSWFSNIGSDGQLVFTRQTDPISGQAGFAFKGEIDAVFLHRPKSQGSSNKVFVDLYRPAPDGDVKLAECRLKATRIHRWKKLTVGDRLLRIGSARYRVDLTAKPHPVNPAKLRLAHRAGHCDLQPDAEGLQRGIPELQDGDYGVFRRAAE